MILFFAAFPGEVMSMGMVMMMLLWVLRVEIIFIMVVLLWMISQILPFCVIELYGQEM